MMERVCEGATVDGEGTVKGQMCTERIANEAGEVLVWLRYGGGVTLLLARRATVAPSRVRISISRKGWRITSTYKR
jgi:hypothetical protein